MAESGTAKRHKAEVDMLIGQAVATGRGQGVPTPVTAVVLGVWCNEIEANE